MELLNSPKQVNAQIPFENSHSFKHHIYWVCLGVTQLAAQKLINDPTFWHVMKESVEITKI